MARDDALDLLRDVGFGRLVLAVGALAEVVPVRFRFDGDGIIFPVPRGSEAHRAALGEMVAVEADHLDPADGWSVVVTGVARETSPPGAPSPGSAGAMDEVWMRLPATVVTGRRLSRPSMLVSGAVRPAWATDQLPEAGAGPTGVTRVPLSKDECLHLLAGAEVGRLAVMTGGRPQVFPVNYVLDGSSVVFRTAGGTKLDAIAESPVTFEIDHFGPPGGSEWMVVVQGVADEVDALTAPTLRARLDALGVRPWVPGEHPVFVRLVPFKISGEAGCRV